MEFSLCWFLFAFLLVVMLMYVSEGGVEVERFSGERVKEGDCWWDSGNCGRSGRGRDSVKCSYE